MFYYLVQLLQFSTIKFTNIRRIGCYWYHFRVDRMHQIYIIQLGVGQYLNPLTDFVFHLFQDFLDFDPIHLFYPQ